MSAPSIAKRPAAEEPATSSTWRQVGTYYALAVLITWTAWAPLVLSRTGLGWLPITVPIPWSVAGTLGPLVAAAVMWRRERGTMRFARVRVPAGSWRRALTGTLLGVVVVALTFVVGTATVLTRRPPNGWHWAAFSLYGAHALTTLLGGPLFEEWGWRGFAQARLQRQVGALPAALAVGVGQGLWHLPLFLIPTWSSAAPPAYVAMVVALAVVMAWGFNRSGGWIGAAILMHYAFNASSRVLGDFLGDAPVRDGLDPVLAILAALAAAALVLAAATRGRLGWARSADAQRPSGPGSR